jgi:epoxyqueuosine reductase
LGDWVFGCDICQEVCPYNASTRNRPRGWTEFEPRQGTRLDLEAAIGMDQAAFSKAFSGSAIKRTKRRGLVRNAALALGNIGDASNRPVLERLVAEDSDPVISDAAEWALRRLP